MLIAGRKKCAYHRAHKEFFPCSLPDKRTRGSENIYTLRTSMLARFNAEIAWGTKNTILLKEECRAPSSTATVISLSSNLASLRKIDALAAGWPERIAERLKVELNILPNLAGL